MSIQSMFFCTTPLSSRVNKTFSSQPEMDELNELTQDFQVMNLSILDDSKSGKELILTITNLRLMSLGSLIRGPSPKFH